MILNIMKINPYKTIKLLFIISIMFFMFLPVQTYAVTLPDWNNDWNYKQEIKISIDTSQKLSINQPIDKNIQFNNPCWGKDETWHSIRILCYHNEIWHELESQIYDIIFQETSIIKSCRIVFLIPEFADGKEFYYVFYDDTEKPQPFYKDHVSISESYYRYEPISGYPLESSYYKITDDDAIPYLISQEGQFMGYNTCQHITKMLDNITEIHPKNGDLFAAFDFKYCYDDGLFDYSSTSQKLVSKEIFIDGNLMISFGMVSTSKKDDLKTTVTYTYYHCPTSTTRIRTHVKHETIGEAVTLMERLL